MVVSERGFFFCNFVRQVDLKSSTKGLSQIWLQFKEESKKYSNPVRTYHLNMTISKKIPQNMATLGNFFNKVILHNRRPHLFWIPKWKKKSSPTKNAGILKPTIIIGSLYSPKNHLILQEMTNQYLNLLIFSQKWR